MAELTDVEARVMSAVESEVQHLLAGWLEELDCDVDRWQVDLADARLYAGAGVPTLHYGPGDLQLAHGPLEKVDIADLTAAARAFALLVLRSCGVR